MRAFIIQYIDAIIPTALGLIFIFQSWWHLRKSSKTSVRVLRVVSPILVIFGLIQFAITSHPLYVWKPVYTNDHRASAEFPRSTETEKLPNSARTVTIRCSVPNRDIDLRLSQNEIPAGSEALTAAQRLEGLKSYFIQQGFAVISCDPDAHGSIAGYRMMLEKNNDKTRVLMRIAITDKAIYRVIVTAASGFYDDPTINRFINSFTVQ